MEPLKIFIGYDSKEPVAFHVLSHSILSRASSPVSIIPLARNLLNQIHTRPRESNESTEFSLTRFLVPHLSDYKGYSIFMDCDMLCQTDITQVLEYTKHITNTSIWVCQHDYLPKTSTKFLGQKQTTYPRKNWSSFMLFNNELCRYLTPERVNNIDGSNLQRLNWTNRFGKLDLSWNWLVGEYQPNPEAKILHYTQGGPWYLEYRDCDHAKEWFSEYQSMIGARKSIESPVNTPILDQARELIAISAAALNNLSGIINIDFAIAIDRLRTIKNYYPNFKVAVTGVGKSGLVGRKTSSTLSSTGTPSMFLHPTEAAHGELGSLVRGDVLLALSDSGETKEILDLIDSIRLLDLDITVVAITSNKNSSLGRKVDLAIETGSNVDLIPSVSSLLMMSLGDTLATILCKERKYSDFSRLHPSGQIGIRLANEY